jgi:hypothetical protein
MGEDEVRRGEKVMAEAGLKGFLACTLITIVSKTIQTSTV